jgi:predicted transcriptional regulator
MSTAPSVSVRLDEETMARLAREALQERRPKALLARLLIVDALADRERQGERVSTR